MDNNVQFENSSETNFSQNTGAETGVISKLFIATGLAKNQAQANYWMLGIVAICFVVIIYILYTIFA